MRAQARDPLQDLGLLSRVGGLLGSEAPPWNSSAICLARRAGQAPARVPRKTLRRMPIPRLHQPPPEAISIAEPAATGQTDHRHLGPQHLVNSSEVIHDAGRDEVRRRAGGPGRSSSGGIGPVRFGVGQLGGSREAPRCDWQHRLTV